MTARNSLKRRVRARMSETGETYSTARRAILATAHPSSPPDAASLTVVLAQPTARSGDLEQDIQTLFGDNAVPDCDVLVLPELIGGESDVTRYENVIRSLARENDCHVVGGSCYRPGTEGVVNAGIVVDQKGSLVCSYEKLRPYGSENEAGVSAGTDVGQFELEGRSFAVLICSDVWFSETVSSLDCEPDTLLIPSFSITQRGEPKKARQLWRHMLVARAYEYSAYVGVCDWAHPCEFDGLSAAGVSGFADPRPDGEHFFEANLDQAIRAYRLDYDRLDSFRDNRSERGFHRSHHSR